METQAAFRRRKLSAVMKDMLKFAVIGHPIGHTMSPFIHGELFRLSGLEASYTSVDVPDIAESEKQLRELDGFNVTIPHKRDIISILDELDEKAEMFGSVNTVLNNGGRLCGYTTDGEGCIAALENHGCKSTGKILICGNGGAARAIASEICLKSSGSSAAELTIAVREESIAKAEELISSLKNINPDALLSVCVYSDLESGSEKYDLLINTTSVGMYPKAGKSVVSSAVIGRCAAVFDCVYNPGETELLKIAAACGKKVIPGIEMLVYQAAAAHRYWYGAKFRNEDIKKLCAAAQRETERVFS